MTTPRQSYRPDPVRLIVRPEIRPDPNRRLREIFLQATYTEF